MSEEKGNNNFYKALDEKKGSCTCQSILILFLGLFLVGSLLIYLFYRSFQARPKVTGSLSAPEILKEKFNEITQKQEVGTLEIKLTDAQLTALLEKMVEEQNDISLSNIQVQTNPQSVIILGTLKKPVAIPLKLEVLPKAEKGKIKVDILKIETGPVTAPEFLAENTTPILGNLIAKSLEQFSQKMEIEEVNLQSGYLILKGKPKNNG